MDEDWDLGMREHLDCLAAEDDRGYATAAVRGHNDQVAAFRRCGIDNRLVWVFMLHMQHLTGDACGLRCLSDRGQGCRGKEPKSLP